MDKLKRGALPGIGDVRIIRATQRNYLCHGVKYGLTMEPHGICRNVTAQTLTTEVRRGFSWRGRSTVLNRSTEVKFSRKDSKIMSHIARSIVATFVATPILSGN
jgi:hypothetical protein